MASLLAQQILVLFGMMACGFILVKLKLLQSADSKILSLVSIYLIFPCVIINSLQTEFSPQIRDNFLLALLAAFLLHLLLIASTRLLRPILKLSPVEQLSLIYSNAGSLIIPLVIAVLNTEWVIYANAFFSVQTLFIWSHGCSVMSGEPKISIKKILTNINIIAVVIGSVLFFAQIRIPFPLSNIISSLGSAMGPVCMVMMGMIMADVHWDDLVRNKRLYLIALFKMILYPAAAMLFLKYSGLGSLTDAGKQVLMISLLAVAAPPATSVTQIAALYDKETAYAGTLNTLCTLCCILTLPLITALYLL